jgi:hypothetical protein
MPYDIGTGEYYQNKKGGSTIGNAAREFGRDAKVAVKAIPGTVKEFAGDVAGLFKSSKKKDSSSTSSRGHGALGTNLADGIHSSADE